ncbi:MAG: Cys-rich peptide radical SAM maturase CcpM [Clostridia bacterium]|nr:Cys-rich peptide radical SAM maturase CcpM [Clostridia bacterium]
MDERPHIHSFKTPGGYYIYDVNTNMILKVTPSVYSLLSNRKRLDEGTDSDIKIIEKMKSDGFLSSNRIQEVLHPIDEVLPYYLDNRLHMITLQITQQCNFRCEYCVYSGNYENRDHSNKAMDIETAKKGIDFLISHSRESKMVSIGFYGGEPLLEFDLIRDCINYAQEIGEGKMIDFSLTTNGTLLNDEIIEFFNKNNLNMTISLDGPSDIHNKNRRFAGNNQGTFESIMTNLEKIKEKYPDYLKKVRFSVVLDPKSNFSCINEFFTTYETVKNSYSFFVSISDKYAKSENEESEDYLVKKNYESFKHFLYKLGRLGKDYVSPIVIQEFNFIQKFLHDYRNPVRNLPSKGHHSGPCVPGVQRLFVTVNGNLMPCERVSELSEMMNIGHVDTGFNIEKCRQVLNVGKVNEKSCKNCWIFRYCTVCAAAADNLDGFSEEKKALECSRERFTIESLLKDYCSLKEFGCKFGNEEDLIFYETLQSGEMK